MVPEAVQHLDQLHTVLQQEMEEEVWDLEAHLVEVEEDLLGVISEVEEAVQVEEDFEEVEVVDLVDNKLIYYPSDIQVSSKHL